MGHLIGGTATIGWVALKAILLYLTALFGFRITHRRTLAEMSPFDFVAAIAVGAIVGRVPNADTTSYLEGATTLATILVAHYVITRLRRVPGIAPLIEHPPRLLVANGRVLDRELRRSGLIRSDLYGLLRQNGVQSLDQVRFVIFEQRGRISIVRKAAPETEPDLVQDVLEQTPEGEEVV